MDRQFSLFPFTTDTISIELSKLIIGLAHRVARRLQRNCSTIRMLLGMWMMIPVLIWLLSQGTVLHHLKPCNSLN
jgi:hypothetical protein